MENNFKVVILTEIGENIGFGHFSRCYSIYQAFVEKQIIPTLIINSNRKENISDFPVNTNFFDWINENDRLIEELIDCDIIIIDSYIADINLYKVISEKVTVCAFIDDNNRLSYPNGIVINGAINSEKLNYSKNNNIKYLLGKKYQPFRKAFWNIEKRDINKEISNVFLSVGANDIYNIIPSLLLTFKAQLPKVKISILVSRLSPNYSSLINLQNENLSIYSDLDEFQVKELILTCDIALCAGGQTLYECVATALPTIAIEIAENQSNNINGLLFLGLILNAGKWNDENLNKKIRDLIENELTYNKRKEISELINQNIDTNGSKRIVKEILKTYLDSKLLIRSAIENDMLDVFNLANDDIVRANSFNQEKIIFENHQKWFKNKLSDKNTLFLIILINGAFSGQIRYDISSNEATINIGINASFRGLGIGELAIIKSINNLKLKYLNIIKINAFVKKSNISSQLVFKKAGFNIEDSFADIENTLKFILYV